MYARTSTSVGFNLISKKKPEKNSHKADDRLHKLAPSPFLSLSTLVLRFDTVLLFDAIWREVQEPRADALRLLVRMSDPYDSFECRIGIVDLIDKCILYHRGQCRVKSGCRFLQIPE